MFTALVVYSTRLTVVYAGFAIIVAALLWTYFGWLILLVGAQLSFYVQNRNYLRLGLTELRLSAVQREQLTLKVMYLIGARLPRRQDALDGRRPRARARHARHRHLAHRATRSRAAQLVTLTDDENLLPARDLGQITDSGNHRHRAQREGRPGRAAHLKIPAVDAISTKMDEAWRKSCGDMTLRDLVVEEA